MKRRGLLGIFAKAGGAAAAAPLLLATVTKPDLLPAMPTRQIPESLPAVVVGPTPYYYDKDGVLVLVAPKGMRVEGDRPLLTITPEPGEHNRNDLTMTTSIAKDGTGTQLRLHGVPPAPPAPDADFLREIKAIRKMTNDLNTIPKLGATGFITITTGAGGTPPGITIESGHGGAGWPYVPETGRGGYS